jgi:hypothetical protein
MADRSSDRDHELDLDHRLDRRRRLRAAMVVGVLASVAASGTAVSAGVGPLGGAATGAPAIDDEPGGSVPEEGEGPTMGAEEIPPEVLAPAGEGDGSVAAFAVLWDSARAGWSGRPAPRPATLEDLVAATSASAFGTIGAVELVPVEVALGDLRSARIDLVIELTEVDPIQAGQLPLDRWTKTLWQGDPVVAPGMLARLQAELGDGPVGAQAVLFGNEVDTPEGAVLAIFDGLASDGDDVARLALAVADPDPIVSTPEAIAEALGR